MRYRKASPLFVLIVIFSQIGLNSHAQSTGLRFLGQEFPADERTSLELFTRKPFKSSGEFTISFDMALERNFNSYFGYVLRMISDDERNIDLILDNIDADSVMINLIVGDNAVILTYPINKEELYNWTRIQLHFNLADSTYDMAIGDSNSVGSGGSIDPASKFSIHFGVNHVKEIETTDLPNMKIREVVIKQGDRKAYYWPLDNIEGDESLDLVANRKARITNPYWLYQDHVNWSLVESFEFSNNALITYAENNNQFYILTPDTLTLFDTPSKSINSIVALEERLYVEKGHGLTYDSVSDELIWYVVDEQFLSTFDFNTGTWSSNLGYDPEVTAYWQHNHLINPLDQTLRIVGGYGQHEYKNLIKEVDLESGEWSEYEPDHSEFQPRYLAGLGSNESADTVYILGGYGSVDGDQMLNPRNWYSLIRFIPAEAEFETVVNYPADRPEGFCISNSLVFRKKNFFALFFSKFESDNQLQLYKGSLNSNELVPLGAPLPFTFHDVETFVDLHYSQIEKKLYSTVTRIEKSDSTQVDIFSLDFPPEVPVAASDSRSESKVVLLIIFMVVLVVVVPVALVVVMRKRKKAGIGKSEIEEPGTNEGSVIQEPAGEVAQDLEPSAYPARDTSKNRIVLFGGFQIINSEGKDITAKFTPLLKEMFLLIFLNSFGERKGVSSEYLKEILWSDKTSKDARNNRAVNMSKLKNLLVNVGDTTISKETGYWKVNVDTSLVYVDYDELCSIINSNRIDKAGILKLTEITRSKPFLHNIHNEWVDVFKAEVSNQTIDTFVNWAMENMADCKPAFIIDIADAIFEFDAVNEEAMELKCRSLVKLGKHSLAKSTYDQFIKEYKILYDEDYGTSFNELIDNRES